MVDKKIFAIKMILSSKNFSNVNRENYFWVGGIKKCPEFTILVQVLRCYPRKY